MCFGHEINGLTDNPNLDLIAITEKQKQLNPQIPSTWYAIEDTHMDGIILWQDSNGTIYESAPNDVPRKIADTLEQMITA